MTTLITALAELIIKSSVVLIVTFLATIALRRHSAALRHTVWTVGLLCSLALPLFSLVLPAWHVAPIPTVQYSEPVIAPPPVVTQSGPAVAFPPAAPPAVPSRLTPERMLMAFWLLGVLLVASLLLREAVRLARVAFGSSTVRQTSWCSLTKDVSNALRLRRPVRLMRNPNASVLGTWGALRPRVLLPRESESWPGERMRVVLSHELAHVKRNDWLVQVIAEFARAIYWFNPLFWFACAQLRRESEHACDDTALRLGFHRGIDGPTYASHVLDLARTLKHSGQPGAAALAMASPSNLERRLIAMLNPSLNRRVTGTGSAVIVVLLALGLTLPLAAMQSQAATDFSATIRANTSVISNGTVQYQGNVHLTTDSVTLTADELIYDPAMNSLKATGKVKAKFGQASGSSSKAEFAIAASSATLLVPSTALKSPAAAGTAEAALAPTVQNPTGTLSGAIMDQTGALIPGVRINMTSQSTGSVRQTLTNESGNFAFAQLPLDSYSITVELANFKQAKYPYVLAGPESNARLNFTLQTAPLSTVVDITAQSPPGLKCFSIFGAFKSDGTPFTEADCPGGTIVTGLAPRPSAQATIEPETANAVVVVDPPVAQPATFPNGRPYPIRVGGDVLPGRLVSHSNPAYPTEARNKGIQGTVIVSGVVAKDGQLRSLKIISSSNPLLETSLLETIQSWTFKPTLLNKEPVETLTTITLNFTLGR